MYCIPSLKPGVKTPCLHKPDQVNGFHIVIWSPQKPLSEANILVGLCQICSLDCKHVLWLPLQAIAMPSRNYYNRALLIGWFDGAVQYGTNENIEQKSSKEERRRWRKRPAFVYFFASGEAALAVFVLVQETQQTSDVYLSLVDPLPNLDPVPSLVKQEDLCSLEVYRDQSRITSCAHPYLEASCPVLYPCCTRRGSFQKTM